MYNVNSIVALMTENPSSEIINNSIFLGFGVRKVVKSCHIIDILEGLLFSGLENGLPMQIFFPKLSCFYK